MEKLLKLLVWSLAFTLCACVEPNEERIDIQTLQLEPESAKIEIGKTLQLKVVSSPTTKCDTSYFDWLSTNESVATINDGTFSFDISKSTRRAYIYAGAGTTAYVNGGTFGKASTRSGYTAGIMGEGKVIITGGTFNFDPTEWVAEGYAATPSADGKTWTVAAK